MSLDSILDKSTKFIMMESGGILALQLNVWLGALLVTALTSFNLWHWYIRKSAKL
ncbi:hypothetical protein PP459_gp049 [Streptomyces phage Wakanda]|uniref:Uncharacterized protein n=1 Tax=Streptomyces phage Wakanda TaxID=2713267 RepID=A0A6G8R1X4_9CAUD|nr:hypothetical protein PP459_gp049 [Streptomyces phage Wakanda]QIN94184.1 hypothetical protein SEA_WAKANDA_224 [Streptomyces phage Wakanda]